MTFTLSRRLLTIAEVIAVVAIFAGWFIYCSVMAVMAGFPVPRFEDGGLVLLVAFEACTFSVAALILYLRGWKLRDFNLRASWSGCLVGSLLYGASVLACFAIWDLFRSAASAQAFLVEMSGAARVSLPVALLVSAVNGAFEEFFLTGYLLKALEGTGASMAIGTSGLIRLLYHLYQGPLGACSALAFGLIIALFYWRYRQLWPAVVAHFLADLIAFA